MNRILATSTLALAAMLSACATPPEKVAATTVSSAPYQDLSCQQLMAYDQTLDASYQAAAQKQEDTKVKGALLAVAVGVDIDRKLTNYVADIKGRKDAVHQVQAAKHCDTQIASQ